jgi:hypothetical protein
MQTKLTLRNREEPWLPSWSQVEDGDWVDVSWDREVPYTGIFHSYTPAGGDECVALFTVSPKILTWSFTKREHLPKLLRIHKSVTIETH